MATNRRVYFPTHAIGIAPFQSINYAPVHGVQQAGINTNFQIDNIQELGQLNVYQLVEQVPEIEVTLNKVLDGYAPCYALATQGASDPSLIGRSNQRFDLAMSVYGDTQSSASGTPTSQVQCSGLYWSQITLTFGTDGTFTEALTAVGNNKFALSSGFTFTPTFTNNDAPLALAGSGGVNIRRDMIFYPILASGIPGYSQERSSTLDANGQVAAFLTILPPDIGVSSSGTNDRDSSGQFLSHIQNITVSCNIGRDAVLELGRKEPYFRFAQFPTQVTCQIAITAGQADSITATEIGYDGLGNNLFNRSIRLRAREGTYCDLGTINKLQGVSFQGGGADGGQVTTTYNYVNWNFLTINHPQDPNAFPYPY